MRLDANGPTKEMSHFCQVPSDDDWNPQRVPPVLRLQCGTRQVFPAMQEPILKKIEGFQARRPPTGLCGISRIVPVTDRESLSWPYTTTMKGRPAGEHLGKGWRGFGSVPEDLRRNTAISVSQAAIEIGGWESGGKPVSIRIPIDIIERLQRTIALQLSGNPPCDVTGVLIGEMLAETSTLSVDSYELARYTLDNDDPPIARDERIHDLAQRWRESDGPRRVLGFFRSQRSGRPAIDRGDLKGAWRLLPSGPNIFLLIGTGEERSLSGMLFFRKNRRARVEKQYGEFSFDAGILRAGWQNSTPKRPEPVQPTSTAHAGAGVPAVPAEAPPQLASAAAAGASRTLNKPAPPPPVYPAPPVAPQKVVEHFVPPQKLPAETGGPLAEDVAPGSSLSESADPGFAPTEEDLRARVNAWFAENPQPKASPAWRSWASIAATWTIAFGATLWFTNGSSLFGHSSPEPLQSRPVTIANSIGLEVHSDGELLNIAWDRGSDTALNSNGGYVTIRDGDLVKVVRLEPGEIRNGHIYYAPRNADLGIRLEMAAEDGDSATETIRIVGPPAPTTRP